jgi:isopentenyldiphosphate isomerase
MANPDEVITLVDENDKVIGKKKYSSLTDDDRWRIVAVWITDEAGNVLIAQRSSQKEIEPNLWGPAVAGTVTDPDSYEDTARRELQEELGLKANNLKVEKILFFDAAFGKRACGVIKAVIDKSSKLTLQEDEVSDIKWLPFEELNNDYQINPQKYTKNMADIIEFFSVQ